MTRLDLSSHCETVRVPRLPVQPERTAEVLMHLARVGAQSTEELLRNVRHDDGAAISTFPTYAHNPVTR